MKKLFSLFLTTSFITLSVNAQTTLAAGPAGGTTYLINFTSACLNTSVQNSSICSGGITASFQFTSVQCCSCPSSGKICLPGSVAYGGSGTSASFTYYHTLSYSPSNEHQHFYFDSPINTFQFSVAGPAGSSESFRAQTYNGATLLSTHTFMTGGTGVKNTYTITGLAFTRVQFTEITAVSADDELFGDVFINGAGCAPLAFELTNFEGKPTDKGTISLSWKTIGEIDNDRFVVLRSEDGASWSEVATVASAGNISSSNNYGATDLSPFAGINYYRLRTIDIQGTEQFSQIIAVNANEFNSQVLVYPNPTSNWLNFNFGAIRGEIKIEFMNELGQIVKTVSGTEALSSVEVTELPTGLYIVKVLLPDGTNSFHKILKQ